MTATDLLPELRVLGAVRVRPADSDLARAEAALGFRLPPSYRAFVQRYGYGLTAGLFIIYVPVDAPECDNLIDRAAELRDQISESVEHGSMDFRPDGSRELVLRAVPFGYSENGDILAWDPSQTLGDGEFWIYSIASRNAGIRKVAPDLGGFLRKALEPGVGGILGRASFQLEPVFEPWDLPT